MSAAYKITEDAVVNCLKLAQDSACVLKKYVLNNLNSNLCFHQSACRQVGPVLESDGETIKMYVTYVLHYKCKASAAITAAVTAVANTCELAEAAKIASARAEAAAANTEANV